MSEAQSWIIKSWELYKKHYKLFIGFFIIDTAVVWFCRHVPVLGFPVSTVLSTLFGIGWLFAIKKASQGEELKIEDIFLGFKNKFIEGLLYTLIYLVLAGLFLLPVILTVGFEFVKNFFLSDSSGIPEFTIIFVIGGLFTAILYGLLLMGCEFALALITYENAQPIEAMKKSFDVCASNIGVMTWYGLLILGLLALCGVTLGLGIFIAIPVIRISTFYAYQDLFKLPHPAPLTSSDQLSTL